MKNTQKGIAPAIIVVLVLAVLVAGGVFIAQDEREDKSGQMMEKDGEYEYRGDLLDVTNGDDVRGINTGGDASGVVHTRNSDGLFELSATFSGLPDPVGTDFYEGWVVRRDPLSVVSTGRLENENGYVNNFTSNTDLSDHDFYVLTLEPDDGDPAPADHIVEGELKKIGEVMEEKEAGAMMEKKEGEKMEEKKSGDAMMEQKENGAMMEEVSEKTEEMTTKEETIEKQMAQTAFTGTILAGGTTPLIDFNQEDYEKARAEGKNVLLYFYANWCPTCKKEQPALEGAFDELSNPNVVGFRVNYNDSDTDQNEKDLAKEFGVPYQHTKVLIVDGEVVVKTPATWSKGEYIEKITSLAS